MELAECIEPHPAADIRALLLVGDYDDHGDFGHEIVNVYTQEVLTIVMLIGKIASMAIITSRHTDTQNNKGQNIN